MNRPDIRHARQIEAERSIEEDTGANCHVLARDQADGEEDEAGQERVILEQSED
jgi:hypothetical protein